MRRFRRKTAALTVCPACGRGKGDRKRQKCQRCPGMSVAASLELQPLAGVRVIGVDASMTMCGVAVTSPTVANRLEVCRDVHALDPAIDEILADAIARSEDDGAPMWLVIEDPGVGGDRATPTMMLAVGRAIGCWQRAWACAGQHDNRVILIRQNTWVAGALAGANAEGLHAGRADRATMSLDVAPLVWGREVLSGGAIAWTDDSAAAALLAWFALRWPGFLDEIGARDRARAAEVARRVSSAPAEALLMRETAPSPTLPNKPTSQRSLFG